jgi:hypothetical protein
MTQNEQTRRRPLPLDPTAVPSYLRPARHRPSEQPRNRTATEENPRQQAWMDYIAHMEGSEI